MIYERYRFTLPDGVAISCRKLRFLKYYNQSDTQGPFRPWHDRHEGPREVTLREKCNSGKSLQDGTSSRGNRRTDACRDRRAGNLCCENKQWCFQELGTEKEAVLHTPTQSAPHTTKMGGHTTTCVTAFTTRSLGV